MQLGQRAFWVPFDKLESRKPLTEHKAFGYGHSNAYARDGTLIYRDVTAP